MINKILKKIIYIEDDADIASIAVMAMETIGQFEVSHFLLGKEALANIKKIAPQLIIVDMMMPEMDGLTFLKNLRQQPEFKDIPVIFMTARIQDNEIKNYLDSGALGVISKPFDPMELCNIINEYWRKYSEAK